MSLGVLTQPFVCKCVYIYSIFVCVFPATAQQLLLFSLVK